MIQLLEDTAATLEYYAPESRPSSATVALFKPGSTTSTASGSATLGSWSTTVSTVTNQTTIEVASSANLRAGRRYWLAASDGWGSPFTISEIDGTTVTISHRLPGDIEATDAIHPLRFTFAIASGAVPSADRGQNWRIEWTITDTDGNVRKYREVAAVVRTIFYDACTPELVAKFVSQNYPDFAAVASYGIFADIAKDTSNKVRRRIEAAGAISNLFGDPSAFQIEVGRAALEVELSRRGLVPPGYDVAEYRNDSARNLSRAINDAMRSMTYDANNDQAIGADEVRRAFVVRAVRQ